MLLVLIPLSFVAFAVREGIDAISLTLAFLVLALVGIARLEYGFSFSTRLAAFHLAIVDRAVLEGIGTDLYFRRKRSFQLAEEASFALRHSPLGETGAYKCYI